MMLMITTKVQRDDSTGGWRLRWPLVLWFLKPLPSREERRSNVGCHTSGSRVKS